ncbi:MAG: LacI family transcriptional regulator [Opitutaceae bacterium]|jgi:LacI family transcriptional regulator|nr:LacI family transcriptional regulator [Opitutaceae bacterium]
MNSPSYNSLKLISKKLGVSPTTVSRVLSGQAQKYRISPETEKAIKDFAAKENFTPNPIAKGLRLKKTLTIGLVIPDIANPFFAGIASQVVNVARAHGYAIVLCDSEENPALEKQSVDLLWARRVDGMILCPVGQTSDHLARYAREKRPLVLVDRVFPDLGLACVSTDNFNGAKTATEYLLDNGHRRIACLQGMPGTAPGQARVSGYTAALRARNVPFDPRLVAGDSFGEQSGYLDTKLLIQAAPDITAIFAMSNLLALGALRALGEENRRVPADVSVIAFDDQPYLAHLAPPLTTVAQPHLEMGAAAVKLLLDQMRSPANALRSGLLLPTSLIIRKSVQKIN